MTKLTPQQKRTRTRRRNAARRAAERLNTPEGRLTSIGASDPPAIRRRLLWFSQRQGIPAKELPPVGTTITAPLVNFARRHDVSLDWLIRGHLVDLRKMLRDEACRKMAAD